MSWERERIARRRCAVDLAMADTGRRVYRRCDRDVIDADAIARGLVGGTPESRVSEGGEALWQPSPGNHGRTVCQPDLVVTRCNNSGTLA